MLNDSYKEYIDSLDFNKLKEIYEGIDKNNFPGEYEYVKNRILSFTEFSEEQNSDHIDLKDTTEKITIRKSLKETVKLLTPQKDYFVTPIIVYLNFLIFFVMVLNGVKPLNPSIESLIYWGGNLRALTLNGQYWRLLTNIFLHGGIFHLLLNTYALLNIGGFIETRFGNRKFLFIYIITGIFASLASISINDNIVSIGASGAIFGMYGLFLSLLFSKNFDISKETKKKLIPSVLVFIGYNLFYGFTEKGIDNAAHIGGLISGIIIGFSYYPAFKAPQKSKLISLIIIIILIAVIFAAPSFVPNKLGEFYLAMNKFNKNEQKALWLFSLDFSNMSLNELESYNERIKTEGIDLWKANLNLLESLTNLPTHLTEQINILKEYCYLRIEFCEKLLSLQLNPQQFNKKDLEDIIIRIGSKMQEYFNIVNLKNE